MSEYQYYEFQAIDRPLTTRQMRERRSLSTRAVITPTRFTNHYEWGNFKGDPEKMMEKYFDAFVYFANWGTRELSLRLPRSVLDLKAAKRYCQGDAATVRAKGDSLILEFRTCDEDYYDDVEDDGTGWLSSLIPLRADLAAGDYRVLYLGWLLCAQAGALDDESREPPVPPGLCPLSAPLHTFAELLRIDRDVMAVAATASEAAPASRSRSAIKRWLNNLDETAKADLLVRVAIDDPISVRAEILRDCRERHHTGAEGTRTVRELLAAAQNRVKERERRAAGREVRAFARREKAERAARAKHLVRLAKRQKEAWKEVGSLIRTKRPDDYDRAVALLNDLRDVAAQKGDDGGFANQVRSLREEHAKKPSLLARLNAIAL